eukprot:TRINITY_DN20080_c0_g1_i1.p1 TRINITY_DN20080_c0_g1~~TRINITY_DN20080_c0_g1_i1.p1  ORF type:complete len:362 (-),score=38.01 TRINITY_DN20080_c0_g1_i1:45-1130(-)
MPIMMRDLHGNASNDQMGSGPGGPGGPETYSQQQRQGSEHSSSGGDAWGRSAAMDFGSEGSGFDNDTGDPPMWMAPPAPAFDDLSSHEDNVGAAAFPAPPPPPVPCATAVGWLFARNLPGNVGADVVEKIFTNYGKVVKVCIMNGRSEAIRSCAFIKYLLNCEAALAVSLLHGRYEMMPGHGPIAVQSNTPGVFVKNLPSDIQEEVVQHVFSLYGRVKTVHIAPGRGGRGSRRGGAICRGGATGERRRRAIAFVEYYTEHEAETATRALHASRELLARAARERRAAAAAVLGACVPSTCGGPVESSDTCVVCLSSPKTHAFVPCGHRCVCAACGDAVAHGRSHATCPVCRVAVESVLQIFC